MIRSQTLRLLSAVAVLLLCCAPLGAAQAHEIRPALLEISEREPGWFEVTWKVPVRGGRFLALAPVFPESLVPVGPASVQDVPGARVERASYKAEEGSLVGETITIDGLSALQIDVLVQVSLADGTSHSAILKPKAPIYTVPAKAGGWAVAKSYWIMGIEHILGGIDHLLFVLALILLIPNLWMLVKAITAFTVSHSITLGLATLGFVHMPPAPTEAVIALSILFLAVEVVRSRQGEAGITQRAPWVVAFIFGLFHGLGFAGALTDVGLPEHAIPVALLMFNVGVETGQLLFLLVVVAGIAVLRRLRLAWLAESWRVAGYAIGSLAAFWTIERVGGFL